MNIEEVKRIKDEFDKPSTYCSLVIWSRKENGYVTISTVSEAIEHSTVSINHKLKDLFPGLK